MNSISANVKVVPRVSVSICAYCCRDPYCSCCALTLLVNAICEKFLIIVTSHAISSGTLGPWPIESSECQHAVAFTHQASQTREPACTRHRVLRNQIEPASHCAVACA